MANYSFDTRKKLSSIIINNQLLLVGRIVVVIVAAWAITTGTSSFVLFAMFGTLLTALFRFFLHPEKKAPTTGKNVIQLGCEWIQIARIVLRAVA